MTDRREVPVETTEGWRPGSSGGERILVALAALAMVGAAFIVAGNLLPKDDAVSVASASPGQTARPSRTQLPSPSPLQLTVVQQSPPPPSVNPIGFTGWIRPKVDLPILPEPSDGAAPIGTVTAGDAFYANDLGEPGEQERGWFYIEGPGLTGYVATRDGANELVERYEPGPSVWPGSIWSLAAGPSGFLAIGNQSTRSNSYSGPMLVVSSDGAQWHTSQLPAELDCCISAVAWGPAGWIMVATTSNSEGTWVWSSQDGEDWSAQGVLDTVYPESLTASESGYLLVASGRGSDRMSWFSSDGIHWTQVNAGLTAPYFLTAITNLGLYAWSDPTCCLPVAAFSADGQTWVGVPDAPHGPNFHLVGLRRSLIAIDTDPQTAAARVWIGSIDGGALLWRPMPGADQEFANAVVTTLVSDGRNATAFGWDRTTEAALVWMSDGGHWQRSELPAAFGGPPRTAVRGATGMAAVGHHWTARGDNPVVWHWDGTGSWLPERVPVVAGAPDPSSSGCSSPPADAIAFVNLDRAEAVACVGDAPITLRLWSSHCDGCSGESPGTFQQKWLAAPSSNVLYVAPVRWPDQWWTTLVLDPSLGSAPDPTWTGTWLDVTGHFDDPAAADCRSIPPPNEIANYDGARSTIEFCRQVFVVTEVGVVEGP